MALRALSRGGLGWKQPGSHSLAADTWRQGVSKESGELLSCRIGEDGCLASQTQPKGFDVTPTDGTAVALRVSNKQPLLTWG